MNNAVRAPCAWLIRCKLLLLVLLMLQVNDLQASIAAVPCDTVLVGTPHDISRLIKVPQPLAVVTYQVEEPKELRLQEDKILADRLMQFMKTV